MANINDILNEARIKGCSDVHIGENTGITLKPDSHLLTFPFPVKAIQTTNLIQNSK